jgi:ubiquinone/menaquinone biosynthesis C-methylase UbiE
VERVPEPELMLDPAQALAYARADFAEPHDRCIALLRDRLADLAEHGRALDLGCGPGDMTIRLARALPGWTIDAVDGSPPMLALGRDAVARHGLAERVAFSEARLPAQGPRATAYDLAFSNSLLHHLDDPATIWSTIVRFTRPGGAVFVMDLMRPETETAAQRIVAQYAASEPIVLRTDFLNSLRAAYRPDEVRAQVSRAGLDAIAIEVVSDRHLIAWGRV